MNPYHSIIEKIAPQHTENYVLEALEFFSFTLNNSPESVPYSDTFPKEFTEIAEQINAAHIKLQDEAIQKVHEEMPNYPFPAVEDSEEIPWNTIEKKAIERLEE